MTKKQQLIPKETIVRKTQSTCSLVLGSPGCFRPWLRLLHLALGLRVWGLRFRV